MSDNISKKIAEINQTTMESLVNSDITSIISGFTETAIKILSADFGFSWWRTVDDSSYNLIYKSATTPYVPKLPREKGGNFVATSTGRPYFVEKVRSRDYEKKYDISPYMKAYAIIPITYKNDTYGSLVICFKQARRFNAEDRELAITIGNAAAQSIIISRLLERDRENVRLVAEREANLKEEKLKTEFIANATHEIRTPLAIIRGNADLVLMDQYGCQPKISKIFKIINKEVDHLSNIISDLTLLTKKDSVEPVSINAKKMNVALSLDNAAKRCATLAKQKNITIEVLKNPELFTFGDELYVERLFLNIIRNAITYGRTGGWIKISSAINDNQISVRFRDNGIGIGKDDLPYIFDRFYRADKSHNSENNNVGLGLAIAKWVVTAHGGDISVKSRSGKGSEFTVTLPLLKSD